MPESQTHWIAPGAEEPRACSSCPSSDRCREVWSISRRGPYTPVGLVLASILVFLLPLLTAITAGALVPGYFPDGDSRSWIQIFAAAGGLLVGAFLAWLLMPLLKKHFHE